MLHQNAHPVRNSAAHFGESWLVKMNKETMSAMGDSKGYILRRWCPRCKGKTQYYGEEGEEGE